LRFKSGRSYQTAVMCRIVGDDGNLSWLDIVLHEKRVDNFKAVTICSVYVEGHIGERNAARSVSHEVGKSLSTSREAFQCGLVVSPETHCSIELDDFWQLAH
jgi:hypothetical protein